MKWLENLTGGYSSSAKVVGETLILSLPDAKSPVVWRMELGSIEAAAFELQALDGDFVLVMRTPKGMEQEIAPFDNRAKALRALMSASEAMEHAQVLSAAVANDRVVAAAPKTGKAGGLLPGLIGIVLVIALLFGMTKLGPRPPQSLGAAATQTSAGGASGGAGSPGVPMSADDFLRAR